MSLPLKRLAALPLAALIAIGMSAVSASTAAAEGNALECVDAGNVWIHIEHDDVVTGACATEFATVTEAMVSTGLAADQGSFYTTVDGVTSEDPQWWSLWTAPVEDGALGAWEFAQVGASELAPEPGSIVGWRLLEDYNKPEEAPQVDPLAAGTSESASPEASETQATAEASPTASASSAEASASTEASPVATTTDAETTETDDSGVPTGTIVGIVAVVAVAAIGGIVWWRRRAQ